MTIEQTSEELILIQVIQDLKQSIDTLTGAITGTLGTNKLDFRVGEKDVAVAGTPVQMPDVKIPAGHSAYIVAKSANTGVVFLAREDVTAESASTLRFELAAERDISFRLDNLNKVWLDAAVGGEGVNWKVEQD